MIFVEPKAKAARRCEAPTSRNCRRIHAASPSGRLVAIRPPGAPIAGEHRARLSLLELVAFVALSMVALQGCAARSSNTANPYTPQAETARNPLRSQELTLQAADLIPKDLAKAESLLREALGFDLYHGPAHNNLGVVYLKQGKLYEAASEFEWAKKLLPGHPDPRINLALTLEKAGRIDDALDTYRTALEVYPDHLPTIQAMTRLQVRAGRSDPLMPARLHAIALRGESHWKSWALDQLSQRR